MAQTPPAAESETDPAVLEGIWACLEKGQEAVLQEKEPVQCKPFGEGARFLQNKEEGGQDKPLTVPKGINIASVCNPDQPDLRKLSANTIKLLAKQPNRINPTGIRLIGGVYCHRLDLVGLEFPYSLVLDKSVFKEGVQARSFRTQGDLSFDDSLILGELFLARVRVDGTIFASDAVIRKIRLLDAEVHGSVLLRNSLVLDLAAFDTVELSGELSVRNARFPYLLVQFSKVGGVLDLTDSRARCSYKIRKSEIGDIAAVNSGFGTVAPPVQQAADAKSQYEWESPRAGSGMAVLLKEAAGNAPPNSDQSAIGKICDHSSISYSPGSMLISDTKIKSSLCLRSFRWLEGAQSPVSFVTIQDVTVGTSALIDLAQADDKAKTTTTDKTHKLEILDLDTRSLFLNFNAPNPPPNAMYISGLKFEQVYASRVACFYEPNFSDSDTMKEADAKKVVAALTGAGSSAAGSDPAATIRIRTLGNDADPAGRSQLPQADEVMGWLNGNLLATTQPFQAFVDVFEKHGEENDAKQLRIAKADAELCLKARQLFSDGICDPPGWWTAIWSVFHGAIALGADFVSVALGGVLWLIADDGYHPEKVGYFVVAAIVLFWIFFWGWLKAVGLKPKEKTTILPFGVVFLFDRLLPAYQIREDHYNVAKYYLRAPKNATGTETMRYAWRDWHVVAASEQQQLTIERSLDVLKVIGLVLAVFLVAAINAIVSH